MIGKLADTRIEQAKSHLFETKQAACVDPIKPAKKRGVSLMDLKGIFGNCTNGLDSLQFVRNVRNAQDGE